MKKKEPGTPKKKGTEEQLSPEMKKLLIRKTPESYIDYSVKSSLTPAEKRKVTRIWLKKTSFTIDDINYARNRHPHWKKIKMKGSAERTKNRMEKYDYSKGIHKKWGKDELREFLDVNDKLLDYELAEKFESSIPSIQGVRRLYNLALKILEMEGKKKAKPSLLKLMLINEKALRNQYRQLGGGKKAKVRKK
jgi:hypothetical protein